MPETTPLVCLCTRADIPAMFGAAFDEGTDLRLVHPAEVPDPAAIRFAIGFEPSEEQLRAFPNLALIASIGAGADGMLENPALPPDLPVLRMVNPAQADMMASYAAYHVIGWHRRMWDYEAQQAERLWRWLDVLVMPQDVPVGILGYGHLGARIGAVLSGLGYPVTAWATRPRQDGPVRVTAGEEALHALLATSRAVVNVLPLTPATRGLLGRDAFARMRPDAILIQIGRGEHVVTAELCAALDAGRPGCAVLDVMEGEPLPPESPLWTQPRLRITPHMASFNAPSFVAGFVAEGIRRFEAGEDPEGLIDRARGY